MTIVTDYRALLSGSYWYPVPDSTTPLVPAAQPTVLSYSFSTTATASVQSSDPAAAATFVPFSESDKTLARAELAQWSQASGVTFLETTQAQGDITFGYYDLATMGYSGSVGLGYYPSSGAFISTSGYPEVTGGSQPVAGDVYVDTSYAGNASLQTDLGHVLVHEIGHTLGLKHPFDAGAYTLDPTLDTGTNTVMSYTGDRLSTLGPLDMAAVSYLYGNFGNMPAAWTWSWNPTSEVYTVHAVGDGVFVRGVGAKSDVVYAPGLHDAVATQQGNDVIYADGQPLSINAGAGNDTVYTGLTYAGLLGGVGGSGDFRYVYIGGYQEYYSVETLRFTDGTYSTATDSFVMNTSLSIAATDAVRAEGNSGSTPFSFTVTRSGGVSGVSMVTWSATGLAPNSANAADFTGGVVPQGTLTFAAGETSKTITVNVAGDILVEPDEHFQVVLSRPTNGATIGTGSAAATITNDDTGFAVASTTGSHLEGNSGATPFVFTVTRSGVLSGSNSVNWTTLGSAPASVGPNDFVGGVVPSGTLSFAPGQVSQTVTVNVAGDTQLEPDEWFKVQLTGASGGATISTASALAKVVNDDTSFSIAATDAAKAEGNSGSTPFTFTVTRTGNIAGTHSISWLASGQGPNSVGISDFVPGSALSGGLLFLPGETTKTITLQVQGDTYVEPDEHFLVLLRNATAGAAISVNVAQGTVLNDDGVAPAAIGGSLVAVGQADFNGDGTADVLRQAPGGDLYVLDGASGVMAAVSRPATGLSFVAAADFNGDGRADLLLRDSTGGLYDWTMDGAAVLHSDLVATPGGSVSVASVADLTGDGRADILLHDSGAGVAAPWTLLAMNGGIVVQTTAMASLPGAWTIA